MHEDGTESRVGSWEFSAGNWLMTGTATRTVEMSPRSESLAADVSLYGSNPAHEIKVLRLSSGDGRWCFEVGIETTKWVIRTVVAGVPGVSVTNGADDIPAAAPCEANHLIPAGNAPFSFRVRLVNNTLALFVNGSETPTLSHALTAGEITAFGRNRHWGFGTDVTSAKVVNPRICSLEADVTPRLDALVGACGGGIYVTLDETGPRLVAAGAVNTVGPVSMCAYQQHVYIVDGVHALVLNISTLTVTNWGTSTGGGVLPGSTETGTPGTFVVGTTRMTIVYNAGDRVGLSGDGQDPQNAYESAIGNADDWDTGAADQVGHAIALSNELPGRIGEPIIGAVELSANSLLYICQNSFWRRVGDFALGIPLLERVEAAFGGSGKDAVFRLSGGSVMVHSPTKGAAMIGAGGSVRELSTEWLTDGITLATEDIALYAVQVLRDPTRSLVYFFLTPRESPDAGFTIHFTYCERTAALYGCGWFATTLPASIGPTASCLWKGKPVLGTRDGYLLTVDGTVKNDDGDAIDCNIPVLMAPDGGRPGPDQETVLSRFAIQQSVATAQTPASGTISYTVFGGQTSEMAYAGTERWTLIPESSAPPNEQPVIRSVRSPVIVMELSNSSDEDVSIRAEMVWGEMEFGARFGRRSRSGVPSLSPPTRSPTGDLSHPDPDSPTPPMDGPGPGPMDMPPPPPPGDSGYGLAFQSPLEMGDQNPELETLYAGVIPGGGGPPPGGGGPMTDPPGTLDPSGPISTVAIATI